MILLSVIASRFVLFFFSSRRRHTRCSRDWSSDVCSSDLEVGQQRDDAGRARNHGGRKVRAHDGGGPTTRSEERRVGKECRFGWWPGYSKNMRYSRLESYAL